MPKGIDKQLISYLPKQEIVWEKYKMKKYVRTITSLYIFNLNTTRKKTHFYIECIDR